MKVIPRDKGRSRTGIQQVYFDFREYDFEAREMPQRAGWSTCIIPGRPGSALAMHGPLSTPVVSPSKNNL